MSDEVSIHAPARGATWYGEECYIKGVFQSTRPRGARLIAQKTGCQSVSFNPRAREGRDQLTKTE